MTSSALTYIVYAPGYSEDSGGSIFMHELVDTLNNLGQRAVLWPMAPLYPMGRKARILNVLRPPVFQRSPVLNTPLARKSDLRRPHVVVYPEVTLGNPLAAKNVARWLLYKPGELHPFEFGPDELFFKVGSFCDLPEITGGAPDLLLWKVNRNYKNEHRTDRSGSCYIVRKGHAKPRIPETETTEAIQIDGMSHADISDVFNRCKVFYSYDEATMYSQFAALCGCLSVVVPGLYKSRADWVSDHALARYGVAYGLDDLDHARATQSKVIDVLRSEEAKGLATVERFIEFTHARFAGSQ